MVEFLRWVADRPRTYGEAMEAWRSSCPRQSVWEDALEDGLIQVENSRTLDRSAVTLTSRGRTTLDGCDAARAQPSPRMRSRSASNA
jgi:hypothetical protein